MVSPWREFSRLYSLPTVPCMQTPAMAMQLPEVVSLVSAELAHTLLYSPVIVLLICSRTYHKRYRQMYHKKFHSSREPTCMLAYLRTDYSMLLTREWKQQGCKASCRILLCVHGALVLKRTMLRNLDWNSGKQLTSGHQLQPRPIETRFDGYGRLTVPSLIRSWNVFACIESRAPAAESYSTPFLSLTSAT